MIFVIHFCYYYLFRPHPGAGGHVSGEHQAGRQGGTPLLIWSAQACCRGRKEGKKRTQLG